MNPSFLRFIKHVRMESSLDNLQRVFVTLFELVKMKKRHSFFVMEKLRERGIFLHLYFCYLVVHHWKWNLSTLAFLNSWVFILSPSRSTFVSHLTPLSEFKECFIIFLATPSFCLVKSMLPSHWSCYKLFKDVSSEK